MLTSVRIIQRSKSKQVSLLDIGEWVRVSSIFLEPKHIPTGYSSTKPYKNY